MINRFSMLVFSISVTLIAVSGQMPLAQPSTSDEVEAPLVLVNGDTITTYDLRLELDIMEKMNPEAGVKHSEPEGVLRRLIQNQLVLQEGYRMEVDKYVSVANQVKELKRSKGMVMLLDSVALSVSADTPDLTEARRKAVRSYIEGLMTSHNVSVDSTLLKSLDYGSADAEVQKYLLNSTDELAVIPTGNMTVGRFTRVLRFTEFHGLVGKPDAAQRRDKAFDEWITEAVLSHQVRIQKLDQIPSIREPARDLEHVLVRQEAIRALLESSYEPQEDEIKQYYDENITAFTSPVRVKMKSKKLNTEEAANAFRKKLSEGANIEWLASNDPEVVPGDDPFPYEWFAPEKLGLKPKEMKTGYIPSPYGVPGGWVVAIVSEIEEPAPIPLDECRSKIVRLLESRNKRLVMADIMARLEDASEIEILPGAENVVQKILEK
jgi:hypothetical protein